MVNCGDDILSRLAFFCRILQYYTPQMEDEHHVQGQETKGNLVMLYILEVV